jgi:D-arginine dehydrogenase
VAAHSDFLIIGAGIAGASIAYWLAPHGRVTLLERESQPGYHSTGRSAALFLASYGTPQVRALTLASRAFFDAPPAGFADSAVLSPRGALFVATPEQAGLLDEHCALLASMSPQSRRLSRDETLALAPVLRPELLLGGALEPDASDIDVHVLHQGYLRGLRRHGGTLVNDAEVTHIERHGSEWLVQAGGRDYRAPLLVNAAGAWCDAVAQMAGVAPIGLQPKRRSAFVFAPPPGLDVTRWPSVVGADESWYFKPDAGLLLGSPANADPVPPQDVQPEEMDIALGIHRIEAHTTLQIRRPARTWAGLRSFVADGDLVGGFDAAASSFFWVAAQGGYGIQTSAAMGQACAALLRGQPIPDAIADFGLTPAMLSPKRLAAA